MTVPPILKEPVAPEPVPDPVPPEPEPEPEPDPDPEPDPEPEPEPDPELGAWVPLHADMTSANTTGMVIRSDFWLGFMNLCSPRSQSFVLQGLQRTRRNCRNGTWFSRDASGVAAKQGFADAHRTLV